jgi:anti-anti-sigma factor
MGNQVPTPAADAGGLSITSERYRDNVVLSVRGEVDVVTGTQLRSALAVQLNDPAVKKVTADLRSVTFMSSTGIAVLVDAHWEAGQHGKPLQVTVGDNHAVLHPLRMTGVDQVLNVHSGPEPAARPDE